MDSTSSDNYNRPRTACLILQSIFVAGLHVVKIPSLGYFQHHRNICSTTREITSYAKTALGQLVIRVSVGNINQTVYSGNHHLLPFLSEGCAVNKHDCNPFKHSKSRLGHSGSIQISSRLDILFCQMRSCKEKQKCRCLKFGALVSK